MAGTSAGAKKAWKTIRAQKDKLSKSAKKAWKTRKKNNKKA